MQRLALSAFAARSHARGALFGVGGTALLLLFIGIYTPGMPPLITFFAVRPEQQEVRPPGK